MALKNKGAGWQQDINFFQGFPDGMVDLGIAENKIKKVEPVADR